jgi:prepilin-type processing-associated H-X9-DG protein
MYAQDWEGYIPNRNDGFKFWAQRLFDDGYLGNRNLKSCPCWPQDQDKGFAQTYGLTRKTTDDGCLNIDKLSNPSNTFLVADSYYSNNDEEAYYVDPWISTRMINLVHAGEANVLFADGHVDSFGSVPDDEIDFELDDWPYFEKSGS